MGGPWGITGVCDIISVPQRTLIEHLLCASVCAELGSLWDSRWSERDMNPLTHITNIHQALAVCQAPF